jgi:hypothetical protein
MPCSRPTESYGVSAAYVSLASRSRLRVWDWLRTSRRTPCRNVARSTRGGSLHSKSLTCVKCALYPRGRAAGSQFGGLERDRPPGPPDASRQTSGIELAQGFPQFALRDLKPVKQVLDRAPRGYGGKTLVHVSPLPRLDIQSGGVGSWRHGAFLSGGAARRHVGNRPEGALTASSGFADAPWNRNRPRISGRGTKPPNVLNDTSHPGGTGVDRRLTSRA